MSSTVFDNGTDRHNNRPTAKQTRQPNQALPMREFRQPFNVFTVVLLPRPFGPKYPGTRPGSSKNLTLWTAGTDA
jgi:hypothetical protein